MNLKQKNGISLIILVITIIIIIILSGTIVSSLTVSNENAKLSVLVNDLAQLQESARAMYLMENKLPVLDNATKISKSDALNLVETVNESAFEEELTLNGEAEDVYFYQLDLVKAGAGEVQNGTGVKGSDDIYVISMNSLKVYYLAGIEYDGNMYFSISSRLADVITIPTESEDESSISINTSQTQLNTVEDESYDVVAPTLQISSTQEYSEFYVVNGICIDTDGVIQNNDVQCKYDYKRIGEVEYNLDEQHMKSDAKIVSLDSNGTFCIKVPKDVSILTVAAIDKAGNVIMQDVNL